MCSSILNPSELTLTSNRISRIVSRVLRDIYSIRPPAMPLRVELAAKYSRDLGEWRANLARFLDADVIDSSLLVPIYQRQRNVLNLAYYHSILLIQRPFLLTNFANLANINKTSDQTTNIDTSQNIEDCLDAAMRIVGIVDDMFKRGGMFSAFWFSQVSTSQKQSDGSLTNKVLRILRCCCSIHCPDPTTPAHSWTMQGVF